MTKTILPALAVVLALSSVLAAQSDRYSRYQQQDAALYRKWGEPSEAPRPADAGARKEYKFPTAVNVARTIKLMPTKPNLVAPEEKVVRDRLDAFDARRKELVVAIETERRAKNNDQVARLMVELDSNRQDRLAYLRDVGRRVSPEPTAEKGAPTNAGTDATGDKEPRPILPIPTLKPTKLD